jgi:hypothetical protein
MGEYSVAIGHESGYGTQGIRAVAIGLSAGNNTQGAHAIAIGEGTGAVIQGVNSIAIGPYAGYNVQDASAVAIGNSAGYVGQGEYTVAMGARSGQHYQGDEAIAIGVQAGAGDPTLQARGQQTLAIAIGSNAGQIDQRAASIAIGASAGSTGMGANAIAIGNRAGPSVPENSIVINASGAALTSSVTETCTIKPIRTSLDLYDPESDVSDFTPLLYSFTSGELVTNTAPAIAVARSTFSPSLQLGASYAQLIPGLSVQMQAKSRSGVFTVTVSGQTLENPASADSAYLAVQITDNSGTTLQSAADGGALTLHSPQNYFAQASLTLYFDASSVSIEYPITFTVLARTLSQCNLERAQLIVCPY